MGIIKYKTNEEILSRADITVTKPLKVEYANGFFTVNMEFKKGHKEYKIKEKVKGEPDTVYAVCFHEDKVNIVKDEKAKGIVIYRLKKEEKSETGKKEKD